MVVKATGAIFVSLKTKRIFLMMRSNTVSHPFTFGFPGGKVNKGEKIIRGLGREIKEEMGFIPQYKSIIPIDVFKSIDAQFTYFTYIILVEKEFIPTLNEENISWGWFDLNGLPKPLHTGAKIVLLQSNFKNLFKEIIADNS